MINDRQVVGVVTANSISYVKALFDCYESDQPVVLLRNETDSRIELLDVSSVIVPDDSKGWFTDRHVFRTDNQLAQIAFTSGTEGEPKGVLLTHQALSDVTERLNLVMEVNDQIREYVGVPANFSFGLGRFRAVSAAGGAAYLPENGFNPLEIREMLANDEINAVSAVPSLWRVLLKHKQIFSIEASRLRWIEIGSQYMSRAEKEELKALFPKAVIAQHYGLTEASRSTFLRIDKVSGPVLESVGRVYGQTELKLTTEGHIAIRGPHVAATLLKNGQYVDNLDADGWFITSDLGELEEGFLFYKGRADDLINCAGIKLSPDALERDLREQLRIKEGIAIAGVSDSLMGQGVLVSALSSLPLSQDEILDAAHHVLLQYGVNNRKAVIFQVIEQFPLTDTNKVQRKVLAKNYLETNQSSSSLLNVSEDERTASIVSRQPQMSAIEQDILRIWQQVLETDQITPDDNFYDIGGDSLSALSALIEMERKGVPSHISRGLLQGLTVREIAQKAQSVNQPGIESRHQIRNVSVKNSMSINIVRGLMVLFVVIAHWHQGVLERLPLVNSQAVTDFFGPLLAMGTPGFAIIYGVGAGYALYPMFLSDAVRLKGILRKTFSLLLIGILTMGAIFLWEKITRDAVSSVTDVTNSFYSVLTYYLLATASIYTVFSIISRFRFAVVGALVLAMVAYLIDLLLMKKVGQLPAEGVIEFIKLLFTAKYAYFQMMSGTLMGMAVGVTLQRHKDTIEGFSYLLPAGVGLLLLGIVLSLHQSDTHVWFSWPVSTNFIWRWITYTGVIVLLIAAFEYALKAYNHQSAAYRVVLQLLAVTGMLAFPIFVLHELVIPLKSVLYSYGVMNTIATILPLLLVGFACALLYRSLYRSSFK